MSDWSEGYMAEVEYTHGYFGHLNPLQMRLSMLNAGLAVRIVETACELGFGQGVSVNVHAAASPVTWFGNDFNPGQVAFAQGLAAASGAGAQLSDESFSDFCNQPDLPDFDFIALHGIWTWISDANRTVIVDFVRRKLKVGGVLCISYNTLHGWPVMLPVRDLLREHMDSMSAPGIGIAPRIDAALGFAHQLLAASPGYAEANPQMGQRLSAMKGQQRDYLAGEYFNHDWRLMSFADVGRWLSPAKVSYACSAKYGDHVVPLQLTQAQQSLLQSIPDPVFRETARDMCVNQAFRMDYWVKGAQRLGVQERIDALSAQRVVLVHPVARVLLDVKTAEGAPFLGSADIAPLLDALAGHQPRTLGELAAALQPQGLDIVWLLQALFVLAGRGCVLPAHSEDAATRAKGAVHKLNRALMRASAAHAGVGHLASPVIGGGIPVSRYGQLFLQARADGLKTPAEWASAALQCLAGQGAKVVKDDSILRSGENNLAVLIRTARERGTKDPEAWAQATWEFMKEHDPLLVKQARPLVTPEDQLEELTAQALNFSEQHLPILLALGVV